MRFLKSGDTEIFIRQKAALDTLQKILNINNFISFEKYVSSRRPFGLDSKFDRLNDFKKTKKGLKKTIVCYAKRQTIGYVDNSKKKNRM